MKALSAILFAVLLTGTGYSQTLKGLFCREPVKGTEKVKAVWVGDGDRIVWKYKRERDKLLNKRGVKLFYSMHVLNGDTIIGKNKYLNIEDKDKIWNVYVKKGKWKTAILTFGTSCNTSYPYEITLTYLKCNLEDGY